MIAAMDELFYALPSAGLHLCFHGPSCISRTFFSYIDVYKATPVILADVNRGLKALKSLVTEYILILF